MLTISWRAKINLALHEKAERKIIEQSRILLEKNGELSVINDVSRVLSTSIELEKLLPSILKTVVERLAILKIAHKGGIFIVNGDKMQLVTHLGHSEEFLKMHEGMTTADCLCGQAARSGKVIISTNSHLDCQHTFRYPTMEPHGHIVVPLTSGTRVMGVLYLYLPEGLTVDDTYRDLLQSIGTQIGLAIDNARLYGETRQLSLHDPLTGIANRRFMDLNLQQAISLAERYKKPLAIAMFDIDHFKKFNDTHGHAAGDKLLARVAGQISKGSRDSDLAARYGGEEFLLILPETDMAGAKVAAERIRQNIAEQCGVTISCGLAQYQSGRSQEQLVKAADAALYTAKENGRNRVEAAE
jgi:diguanylate cyclase (GGDEF)-like protein